MDMAACRAAVLAHPDEDVPRLMFADAADAQFGWLSPLGEFVRAQCELARMPPKPRELCVVDGAGTRMEGLGVALTPRGDGHYSASNAERGLSFETFKAGERVDIYAHLARNDRIGWMRGLKYVKHNDARQEIIFRKDAESGPWAGTALQARAAELEKAHRAEWLTMKCGACGGKGDVRRDHSSGKRSKRVPCPDCKGGDAGGLTWPFDCRTCNAGRILGIFDTPDRTCPGCRDRPLLPDVSFRRGFPAVVTVPRLADAVGNCPRCYGSGVAHGSDRTFDGPQPGKCPVCKGGRVMPTDWLAAACRHHPIAQVIPGDREPASYPGGIGDRAGYWWEPGLNWDAPHQVPFALGETGVKAGIWRVGFHGGLMVYVPPAGPLRDKGWDTAAEGVAALARVVAAFGQAGSPAPRTGL